MEEALRGKSAPVHVPLLSRCQEFRLGGCRVLYVLSPRACCTTPSTGATTGPPRSSRPTTTARAWQPRPRRRCLGCRRPYGRAAGPVRTGENELTPVFPTKFPNRQDQIMERPGAVELVIGYSFGIALTSAPGPLNERIASHIAQEVSLPDGNRFVGVQWELEEALRRIEPQHSSDCVVPPGKPPFFGEEDIPGPAHEEC
jgi:hypothetical protein